MSRSLLVGTTAVVAVASALGGGYWLGRSVPVPPPPVAVPAPHAGHEATPAGQPRTVVYYRDPSGKPDFSPEPKKDAEGRDYVPVYADEETQAAPAPAPETLRDRGKILYYRNPMGLPDTSPTPKKDPMGMDYVPVYESDDDGGATVKISPDRVQKLGVRTVRAEMRRMTHTVRAVGTVQVDERRQYLVAPKFEGYAETLHIDQTGQNVRKGQPLLETYSPDLVLAQEEYLSAFRAAQSVAEDTSSDGVRFTRLLADGALNRLRNWDIPTAEIAALKRRGTASHTITLTAPATGVVLEKNVISGQRFMPGEVLYKIADLSDVWLIADVFEQELPYVGIGQTARVSFSALPDRTFSGKVTFIYPTLSPDTRTAKVRIELPNGDGRLKPALYGTVNIAATPADREVLAVPDSALLDSGTRTVVLVDKGEGRFEPREVKTGARADGYVEVTEGVSSGENVVVSANFLIDAESNLRAAMQSVHHH